MGMKLSYLPKEILLTLLFFLFLTWFWDSKNLFSILLFSSTFLFFLFRKANLKFGENKLIPNSFIVSPSNGKVHSVRRNVDHAVFGKGLSEIRVSLMWFYEFGIGFPLDGEIRTLKVREGKPFFRLFKKGLAEIEKTQFSATLLEVKGALVKK